MPIKIVGLDWRGGPYTQAYWDLPEVPHKPGLYKLHYREPNGEWTVFYVGQAQNLYEALVSHLLPSEPDPRIRARVATGQCAFSYAVLQGDEAERAAALRSLYDYYQPPFNDPAQLPASDLKVEVNPN